MGWKIITTVIDYQMTPLPLPLVPTPPPLTTKTKGRIVEPCSFLPLSIFTTLIPHSPISLSAQFDILFLYIKTQLPFYFPSLSKCSINGRMAFALAMAEGKKVVKIPTSNTIKKCLPLCFIFRLKINKCNAFADRVPGLIVSRNNWYYVNDSRKSFESQL